MVGKGYLFVNSARSSMKRRLSVKIQLPPSNARPRVGKNHDYFSENPAICAAVMAEESHYESPFMQHVFQHSCSSAMIKESCLAC